MKRPGIKKQIFVPLCAALIALMSTFALIIYKTEQNEIAVDVARKMSSVEDLFRMILDDDIKRMSGLLKVFLRDERLAEGLRSRDRSTLYEAVRTSFDELRSEQSITHFYFSGPDRVNILRVHMPGTYGDRIDRLTTLEAEKTGAMFGGIELGPLGTLSVRVVAPWYGKDGLIGFAELGEEIEHITRMLRDVLDVELYVAIRKDLLDRAGWEDGMRMLGREAVWNRFPSMVIVDRTNKSFAPELEVYLEESHQPSGLKDMETSMNGRLYRSSFLNLSDAGGRSVGKMVIMLDVTNREQALRVGLMHVGAVGLFVGGALLWFFYWFWGRIERQLNAAQATILDLERDRSRFVLDNIPAHISLMDERGCFTHWSPYSERIFGYTASEAVGRIGPSHLLSLSEQNCGMPSPHTLDAAFEAEVEGRNKDGASLWLKVRLVAMPEREGNREQLCIMEDISGRKQTEEALLDSEERYRVLFNRTNDAVFVHEPDAVAGAGRFIEVNDLACRKLGYTREELLQMSPAEVDAPERREVMPQLMVRLLTEKNILFETIHVTKDGCRIPVEIHSNLFELKGRPTVLSVARDISERKQVEKELIHLATAMEQVAEGVLITDTDWKITYMNSAFEHISGFAREEAVGKHPRIFKSGEYGSSFFRKITETLRQGEVWSGQFNSRRKDGTFYEVEATITPIRTKSGQISSYVTVERDITHEAQLERQLRRAQKMDALGRLAGGIAHDFNNNLSAIMGNIEMALLRTEQPTKARHNLQQAMVASSRATDLVKQILTFSRQSEQERKPVRLGILIKETLGFLRASLPTTIDIRRNITTDGMVNADPSQIHQVLVNLCTNAAHAMREKGGVLEVTLVDAGAADQSLAHPLDLSSGGSRYLKLTVADTGHGIDASILDRIFDPYFTTKKPGEGTGLGLAMVHGIVESHGGMVTVRSEIGTGSAFHVFLPGIDSGIAQEVEVMADLPKGNERILLVDDEQSLAEVGCQMLNFLGYKTSVVTSSMDALELFQANPEEFDLVITDQTMPKMTGLELAGEILRIRPGIPVVLCTGFSEKTFGDSPVINQIQAVLMKPVILKQLANTVRKALDAG